MVNNMQDEQTKATGVWVKVLMWSAIGVGALAGFGQIFGKDITQSIVNSGSTKTAIRNAMIARVHSQADSITEPMKKLSWNDDKIKSYENEIVKALENVIYSKFAHNQMSLVVEKTPLIKLDLQGYRIGMYDGDELVATFQFKLLKNKKIVDIEVIRVNWLCKMLRDCIDAAGKAYLRTLERDTIDTIDDIEKGLIKGYNEAKGILEGVFSEFIQNQEKDNDFIKALKRAQTPKQAKQEAYRQYVSQLPNIRKTA